MPDPDETFRQVIEAAQRSHAAREQMWRDVLPEAQRRLATDPLFRAQATAAGRVVESQSADTLMDPDARDVLRYGSRLGAAVALVIAERAELITGERPTGAPPVEVIAARLAPLLAADYSHSPSLIRQAAASVLTALALQGFEVTRRADRFASLQEDGRRVRIPLRGRCGICQGEVLRDLEAPMPTEVLIGPWRHAGGRYPASDAGHEPVRVDAP